MMRHDSGISRRRFLSASIGSLATVGLGTWPGGTARAQDEVARSAGEPIYRTLGRTGIRVPVVSMGVMNASAPEVVSASYDLGVRHFDTAARYQYGRNEQMVGNVIAKRGVRDQVVIGTKIMRPAQRESMTRSEAVAEIAELCEGSLRRLKTDYVDILYIHSVSQPEDFNGEEIMEAFAELKKQGKIRAAGVSTHRNMATVIREVTRGGFYDVVLTAVNVAMADDSELLGAIDDAAAKGVGIVAMKTQAGGQRLPNPGTIQDYPGSVVATASLKWVLRRESIATAIPGYDNFEHMRQDISVISNLEFSPEEKAFLSANDITLSMGFCRQCERCLPSCPHGVEVPTLMRTYMYAAQYSNFHEAREALQEIAPGSGLDVCVRCRSCDARCAHTVDIARRIGTLREIYT